MRTPHVRTINLLMVAIKRQKQKKQKVVEMNIVNFRNVLIFFSGTLDILWNKESQFYFKLVKKVDLNGISPNLSEKYNFD
jgi:hypothetical protein